MCFFPRDSGRGPHDTKRYSTLSFLIGGRNAPMPVKEACVVNVYGYLSFGYPKTGASKSLFFHSSTACLDFVIISDLLTDSVTCKNFCCLIKTGKNFYNSPQGLERP